MRMRQIAWLDFYGGRWHLLTRTNQKDHRKWTSQEAALSDLKAEGWIIDGQSETPPRARHDPRRHSYGYELRRTVH